MGGYISNFFNRREIRLNQICIPSGIKNKCGLITACHFRLVGKSAVCDHACGNAEEIYRDVVAGMDELAWLDPDAAGLEAARRWFAAIQLQSSPADLNTDDHRAVAIAPS